MYKPTPIQVEDSDDMLKYEHALLWADAGTGKTVTAIEAFKKGGYDRIIVIAPKIALTMWYEELKFHGQLDFPYVIRGGAQAKTKKAQKATASAQAIITTYDLCRNKDVQNVLMRYTRQNESVVVILDEHQYVKGVDAARTTAVLGPRLDGRGVFTGHAEDVWFLSGDPIMNYQNDLYPALKFARPEILAYYHVSRYEDFMDMFCIVERKRHHPRQMVIKPRATGDRNTPKLKELLAACEVKYRTLDEATEGMPEVTHRIVTPGLSTKLPNKVIEGMSEKELMAALESPNSELARIRRVLGMSKTPDVCEYAEEQKPPLLIGAWHIDVINFIAAELGERKPNWVIRTVSGGTPSGERDEIQAGFNGGSIDVVVGQMSAMNVSWNLQERCRHVLIAEEIPSYGMLHQFYSRVHRRGQKNHVQVDHMTSDHEIDEVLRSIRARKSATKQALRKG